MVSPDELLGYLIVSTLQNVSSVPSIGILKLVSDLVLRQRIKCQELKRQTKRRHESSRTPQTFRSVWEQYYSGWRFESQTVGAQSPSDMARESPTWICLGPMQMDYCMSPNMSGYHFSFLAFIQIESQVQTGSCLPIIFIMQVSLRSASLLRINM